MSVNAEKGQCTGDMLCFELSRPSAGVAHLKFNRPKEFNSMTWDFWHELPRVIRQLDEDGETRVLVISSTGKHFSAGMDLSVFQNDDLLSTDSARHRERFRKLVLQLQEAFSCLEACRMPVIAAIQGGCIGGAVDMVCACDMRYAVNNVFFSIEEVNIGIMADLGTLQRLPTLIPPGVVRELAYTGERLPAERAKSLGLVNEIFASEEDMLAHVLSVAEKIAGKSPLVISATKEAINYVRDHDVRDSLSYAAAWQSSIFSTKDIAESVAARKQNRAADFENLLTLSCK